MLSVSQLSEKTSTLTAVPKNRIMTLCCGKTRHDIRRALNIRPTESRRNMTKIPIISHLKFGTKRQRNCHLFKTQPSHPSRKMLAGLCQSVRRPQSGNAVRNQPDFPERIS